MKRSKQALFHSIVALILCLSMFVGTTFALFSENVSSGSNLISSGNLRVKMYWTADLAPESGDPVWTDASEGTLFGYANWEPGYTDLKYLKVENVGSLAFQYELNILPYVEPSAGTTQSGTSPVADALKLAEVIDVYVGTVNGEFATRQEAVAGLTKVGNLYDLIQTGRGAAQGIILPESTTASVSIPAADAAVAKTGSETLCIMLKMREDAGNAYMNLSAGDGFRIQLKAVQYTYEEDSFGNDYDSAVRFPELIHPVSESAAVNVVNGATAEAVTMGNEQGGATVPAGVAVVDGTTQLTLTITEKSETESNVTLGTSEAMRSLDVHMEGVSPDNTVPMIINMGPVMPAYQNMGNVKLYHVENGVTNAMTQVNALEELDTHNEFYYDAATGSLTVALATFSEIATVADLVNAWNGTVATTFADGTGTESDPYLIANADQLAYMGDRVSNDNANYGGAHYKLMSDINIGGESNYTKNKVIWYPIGYSKLGDGTNKAGETTWYTYGGSFKGVFDGAGHTVSGIYQNTWAMDGNYDNGYYKEAMGLFGYVNGGTVKNLTIDNFYSEGEFAPTGCVAAYAAGKATFENIAITNSHPQTYNTGVAGIVGWDNGGDTEGEASNFTFKNITIDSSNTISALWGSWDVAAAGLLGYLGRYSTADLNNCHVSATIDVYNDVCGNYQYYWYRYCGMLIGTVDKTKEDGSLDLSNITATGCTVNFGDRHEYYYCEFIGNSIASYTHDYQFSRVSHDELDFTRTPVVCTHVHSDKVEEVDGNTVLVEDKRAVYIPFRQLFGGYGWGVDGVDLGEYENIDVSVTQVSETKFKVKSDLSISENDEIIVGDIFEAVSASTSINSEAVQVSVTDLTNTENPITGTFTPNTTDWTQGTIKLTGITGTLAITIQDYHFCKPTTAYFVNGKLSSAEIETVDRYEIALPNVDKYLYRVGNANAVKLESLFTNMDGATIDSKTVKVEISGDNASGTYTADASNWKQGTIQFSGTGLVTVTISDNNHSTPVTLNLEVVDAYNRTTASFGGNSVLLCDVNTSSSLSTSGIIYGNGFTINMENAPISEKNGAVFHLYDGAILKHVNIVGKEFTTVAMNVNDTNYGVSAVRAWGTVTIENCYISGCRSAVSATGTELTIKDSVIANGVYANIDFRSGILNLHNVTTINEPHSVNGTTVVGLGIVGNMTASAGRQINISGSLTQYNWLSQADCANIKASGVDSIFNSVFTDSKYASLRYTYNGTTYVNTGILSLCSDFGESAVTGVPTSYTGMNVTATISNVSVDGYVWAPGQAGTLSDADMKYHDTVYVPESGDQGTSYIPPAFVFEGTGLTAENGVVQIKYESGSSYTLTADTIKKLLTPVKHGKELPVKISMNGTDYTGKDIVFDAEASQNYTITYTITDNQVYDKDGNLTDKTYEVKKELYVFATVIDKGADAPTFTFYYGTNGSASAGTPHTTQPTNSYTSTIKQVGETYYIMPNVSATTANAIGSQTVDGETVYYPIVDGINVQSGNSTDYDFTRYYPVFKAVKISDNGTEYSYSGTKEMPATVAWVSATIDSGNGASALNDGFGLYNNQYLCKIQKKAGDAESGGTSVVKYSYTALDGNTYYYYVGYRFYDEDEGGVCVAPDTLITLADGSQKRIDEVTFDDKILAWDFFTGDYVEQDIALLVNHGEARHMVTNLEFSDSTKLRLIGEHGVFDYDLNKYVYITVDNMHDYIGHRFVQQDLEGGYNVVTLDKAYMTEEVTNAYSITSAGTSNAFASGMLTVAPPDDFYNWIEMDGKLRYDAEQFAEDVETYGLYTYDVFKDYVTYEQFVAFNGAYLKIPVEKGLFTFDYILELIDLYAAYMPQ